MLQDCNNSLVQFHPQHGLRFGALMAAVIERQPCLVEYSTTDFQPEIKEDKLFFVSLGSGQLLADPFLAFVSRVMWKGVQPTVQEAKFGVYWALNHTIKLAPGGVGLPINLAALHQVDGQWKAEMLPDSEESAEYIAELEEHIGSFVRKTIDEAQTSPIPQAPRPID